MNSLREIPPTYAITALACAAIISSGFEDGRKALQRAISLIGCMFGGAPYNVELPGPTGAPLVGNLTQV